MIVKRIGITHASSAGLVERERERELECIRCRTESYKAKIDGNMEQEEDHLITDFRLTQRVWKAASRS